MHPRLIHSFALIEPIIQRDPLSTSYRSDLWPSRGETKASFQKKYPFFELGILAFLRSIASTDYVILLLPCTPLKLSLALQHLPLPRGVVICAV